MTAPENFKKSLPQLGEEVSRAQNPYIGPRPFADNEREQQLFFGREREGADLLSLVMADRSVLFYAPSGAGKSSLVNARLLPALRAEGFVVLGRARVGGQLPADLPVTAVANVYVYNLLRDLDPGHQGEVSLRRQRLPDFLAQGAGEESDRVLVIDQFEEIFTTYPEQWEKREDFFRQLSQALSADPRLWVILTMREDYIAELDPYARLLPNRLRVRYRLNYMDATAALAAVTKPAELGGRPFEPGVAERLVDNLRQRVEEGATESPAALGEMVEPVQLQVVCMQLWQRLLEEPGATITAEDVEKLARGAGLGEFVNHALASFYEQTLAAVVAATTTGVSERELRDWFSQRLITRDGTRNLLYQSDTETDTLPNPVALALEQRFLLRGETRGGGRWVELIHDRLIGPIREANERWRQAHSLVIAADLWNVDRSPSRLLHSAALAEAEQALAATPHLYGPLEHSLVASSAAAEAERLAALQAREAAQQQEAKRDRLIAIGATVAAISMLLLLLLSLWFASQAAANYVRAQAEAVSRTLEAARARQLADTAREQAAAAEAARSAADAARVDAVQARARTEQLLRQIRGDQLASQAVFALSSRPQQALLLAVEAMRVGAAGGQFSHTIEQAIHDGLAATGGLPLASLSDSATALTLSPDAHWAAAASEDGALVAWRIAGGTLRPIELAAPGSPVSWALAFSSEGRLAAAADDGTVRTWWPLAGPARVVVASQGPLYSAVFSPDGRWLAAGGEDGALWLWDSAAVDAAPQRLAGPAATVNLVRFSPDGRWLAAGGEDGALWLWPIEAAGGSAMESAGRVVASHAAPVSVLAFSPDSRALASGDRAGDLWFSPLAGGEPRRLVGHRASIRAMEFALYGSWLATGDENGVLRVWNLDDPNAGYRVHAHALLVSGLAFVLGASGERLVTVGYDDLGVASVRIWQHTDGGAAPVILRGHDGEINLLATVPGVNGFLTAGYDRTLRIWRVDDPQAEPSILASDGRPLEDLVAVPVSATLYAIGAGAAAVQGWSVQEGRATAVLSATGQSGLTALAADGSWVAAGDAAGRVMLWRPPDASPLALWEAHRGRVNGVALHAGLGWLASAGDDGAIRLWTVDAVRASRQLTASQVARATAVQFSAAGDLLAAASSDGRVTVWQLNQLAKGGQVLQAGQSALTALAFSPTGSRLAAADLAGALWIWNLAALEEGVLHWEAHRSEISSLLFGGDQSQLYTASADRTVRLWNLSVEPPIPTVLAGHQASVNGLASLGGQLYTASTDGTLRQWLLTSVDLAKRACQVAGRNLDQEEWARFRPGERCRATCPGLPSRCGVDSPAATGP